MFAALEDALEGERISALLLLPHLRPYGREDRLARESHMQRAQVAIRIETADQPALHHRVVAPMQHVFLARPEELHRRAGHLLRDEHGLRDVIVRIRTAPAEATAEESLVDVDLVGR